MKAKQKRILFVLFMLLAVLMLSIETKWHVCKKCGVQSYEHHILGKKIEFLGTKEYDEFGTHKKWIETYGAPHRPHEWIEVIEPTTDLLENDFLK